MTLTNTLITLLQPHGTIRSCYGAPSPKAGTHNHQRTEKALEQQRRKRRNPA